MWSFQYKNGDRPLDGFTIQRAAGRGGFGEVYYAVSDSGREVALKAVQGYEQIELRGISQCMNLKSPHLVTIFDVKYNDQGKPFVIMEYVSGPSLRQLLDESPAGLGTQKAAFFLREIGKGLTFLHECGIVHRDLKPGNIFFENGYVKIGDYGLSKAISPTEHSGQTVTVGTVHYMAPEVGVGKYDRSIDIYAMGAVLYEMLTGTVPFIGASPSEILMKHLQAEPDMSGVPEPFNTVIRKAMAKNPTDRYQSVQEMVEAVFGTEHVRMSVSCFSPEDLSMVAGRVAQKVAMGGGRSSSVVGGSDDIGQRIQDRLAEAQQRFQDGSQRAREAFQARTQQVRDRFRGMGLGELPPIPPVPQSGPRTSSASGINDPLPIGSRVILGLLTCIVVSIASGVLIDSRTVGGNPPFGVPLFVFLAVGAASLATVIGWRRIVIPKLRQESHAVRKLAMGIIVSGATLIASGFIWALLTQYGRFNNGTWISILAPLWFCNTWQWARANRKERVSLGPAICIGIIGFILCGPFHGDPVITIAVLCGTSLVVQVLSPWDPLLAANRRGGKQSDTEPDVQVNDRSAGADMQPEAVTSTVAGRVSGHLSSVPAQSALGATPLSYARPDHRPAPRFAPYVWLGMFIITLTVGLMCTIAVGTNAIRGNDQPPFIGFGIAGMICSLICLVRVFTRRFYGWWTYAIRPALFMVSITSILVSSMILGQMSGLGPDDRLGGIFFIVFPSLILLTLAFIPRRLGPPPLPRSGPQPDSPYTRGIAMGLCVLWVCGAAGIHRFYVGKIGTGLLWLLTGGLFGIGQLVDMIMICTGQFTDAQGRVLRLWDIGQSPTTGVASAPRPAGSSDASPQPTPAATAENAAFSPAPAGQWIPPLPSAPPLKPSEPRTGGGILSAFTALLMLATLAVSLAIGFDLPLAVVNGLPDARAAQDIRGNLFGNPESWQIIVTQLLWVAAVVLVIISVGMMMAARRRTNLLHIVRGLMGIAGLLGAVAMLTSTFNQGHGWNEVARYVHDNNPNAAIQTFTHYFADGHPIGAAAICLVSFLILAIPYHRRALEKDVI